MSRFGTTTFVTAVAASLSLTMACGTTPSPDTRTDFEALQVRGEAGMGVDQYASTHVFDALPDGGRIEYRYDSGDAAGVAQIRSHLEEIREAFEAGDFSTPAFVHDREVPGTDVMARRSEHIEYLYRDVPRGGEIRLVTTDPEALEAIRRFMAFQRTDHRAEGVDHGTMDHGVGEPESTSQEMADHTGHNMDDPGNRMGHPGHRMEGPGGPTGMGEGGHRMGTGMGVDMGAGDPAFAADMEIVHELVTNNRAITRTVTHLPNGIRTLTESSSPAIAALIVEHVASMARRLEEGEVFNLFSHTLPVIFEGYEQIDSEFEYLTTGVAVVQTSDDPAIVEALQAHAAEVTELVDEGMIAMMRGMMQTRVQGGTRDDMHGNGSPN